MPGGSWQDFLGNNLGKVIGILTGLILGWMILEYGLIKTLFVVILIVVGFHLGKKADEGEDVLAVIRRFFKGY